MWVLLIPKYYIQITRLAFMNVLLGKASKLAKRCEKLYCLGSRLIFYIAPWHKLGSLKEISRSETINKIVSVGFTEETTFTLASNFNKQLWLINYKVWVNWLLYICPDPFLLDLGKCIIINPFFVALNRSEDTAVLFG